MKQRPDSDAAQGELFERSREDAPPAEHAPLAARMRPRSLDAVVGQEHLLGPGKPLRLAVERKQLGSVVLWGPPGTGKTSLAALLAAAIGAHVSTISAVASGVAELRRTVDEAKRRGQTGRRTCLIVDEVHRWNAAQQDALLPSVEQGTILLIGLTSENPYFDLVPALRSRVRILRLNPLTEEQVATILRRALADTERGLGGSGIELDDDALAFLAGTSGGDARIALNGLEAAAVATERAEGDRRRVTAKAIEDTLQRRSVRYDRAGDDHYQTASALIKSIRGSDPDAAVFWLAKMLAAGEDPRFLARRLVISASEDTGTADSSGLVVAEAAARAVEYVGMPEAQLVLAHAAVHLASIPKSNAAAKALWAAQAAIERGASLEVPLPLRTHGSMWSGGDAPAYDYSHDFAEDDPARYRQRYLPDGVAGPFYVPTSYGDEAAIKARLDGVARMRAEADRHPSKKPASSS